MGHQTLSEALESQGHKGPDLKQLSEHQQNLRHFMESWFSQHDQILQAITNAMQAQDESTLETLRSDEVLALGPQVVDQDGSSQSVPCDSVQMRTRPSQHRRMPSTPRNVSTCSYNSDILHAVRDSSDFIQQAAAASQHSMSFVLEKNLTRAKSTFTSVESETMVSQRMVKLVSSHSFESLCSICTIINAVVIAYAADYAASHMDNPRHPILDRVEMGFAMFYIIEWVLRLVAYRLHFFFAPDSLWNIFDTILVVSAAYDLVIHLSNAGQGRKASMVFMRVVRVIKMFKLLRMVRIMRMFRELRLIASLMRASLKPLLWAIALISIISYIAGLCFLNAGTNFLQDGNASQEEAFAIKLHWGSVLTSMLSLYMASTNGDSWKSMANSLKPVGDIYYALFLLYIAFFVFVVMNTLTSLFLEAVIQNADRDTHTLINEELRRIDDYMTRAAELFRKIDLDCSGDVTEEEFLKYARDADMTALASSLELDVSDMMQFYKMLSCRGKYPVDKETFTVGCLKLRGPARAIDLQALIASQTRNARTLEDLLATSETTAALVQQILPSICSTQVV